MKTALFIIAFVLTMLMVTHLQAAGWELATAAYSWYTDTTIHWNTVQQTLCGDSLNYDCMNVNIYGIGLHSATVPSITCTGGDKKILVMYLDWRYKPNEGVLDELSCCTACTTHHMPLINAWLGCVDEVTFVPDYPDSGMNMYFSSNCRQSFYDKSGKLIGGYLSDMVNLMNNIYLPVSDTFVDYNLYLPTILDTSYNGSATFYTHWSGQHNQDTIKIKMVKPSQYLGSGATERPYVNITGHLDIRDGRVWKRYEESLTEAYIVPYDSLTTGSVWCLTGKCSRMYPY